MTTQQLVMEKGTEILEVNAKCLHKALRGDARDILYFHETATFAHRAGLSLGFSPAAPIDSIEARFFFRRHPEAETALKELMEKSQQPEVYQVDKLFGYRQGGATQAYTHIVDPKGMLIHAKTLDTNPFNFLFRPFEGEGWYLLEKGTANGSSLGCSIESDTYGGYAEIMGYERKSKIINNQYDWMIELLTTPGTYRDYYFTKSKVYGRLEWKKIVKRDEIRKISNHFSDYQDLMEEYVNSNSF